MRGTTASDRKRTQANAIISIHVPREGHDAPTAGRRVLGCISIHVPREGHDHMHGFLSATVPGISIHVPREGHDWDSEMFRRSTNISIHVPREGHDMLA